MDSMSIPCPAAPAPGALQGSGQAVSKDAPVINSLPATLKDLQWLPRCQSSSADLPGNAQITSKGSLVEVPPQEEDEGIVTEFQNSSGIGWKDHWRAHQDCAQVGFEYPQ